MNQEFVTVDGVDVPALGFGTARIRGEDCVEAVRDALEVGYRHLDTAQMYDNERRVGEGIASADLDREELFLTTKLHPRSLAHEDVHETTRESLSRLDTEYVDLLLIHAPGDVPIEETIGAMNELQEEGAVRHVGVSNFSIEELEAAMAASRTPVITNQIEYHPRRDRREHLRFCVENDVMLTVYSPLGVGDVLDDPVLAEIGEVHGKSPAQVALRWLLDQPMVAAIPKAASPEHRRENWDIFDFDLSAAETERVFEVHVGLDDELRELLGY
jgi:2,5-diketo-D-gluconate reductase B